jgi:hypothetical protein
MGKISINLDESSLKFLDEVTNNRSSYLNNLLQQERKKAIMAQLKVEYLEQSNDPDWQAEVQLWDCTAGDGLDDSVEGLVQK